ncbi:MAG: putative transglutaminase-like protease, partial [Paracoccaceae bacterium]
DLQHFRKFDPILSRSNKVTITLQYFVATVCYFWLVTSAAQLTSTVVIIGFLLAVFTLISIGLVADQSHKLIRWEYFRLFAVAAALILAYYLNLAEAQILIAGAVYTLVSCALSWLAIGINRASPINAAVANTSTTS